MKGLRQPSSFSVMSMSQGGAGFWSLEGDSGLLEAKSLIEGLRRSWTNTPTGTRARREPSLESTSAAMLLHGTCWNSIPLEVTFEFTNLSAVSIHRVLEAIPLFVDLLDDDLGIAES
jgi:hypothetical protein